MTNSTVSEDEKVDDTEREATGNDAVASGEAQTKPSAEPDETDNAVEAVDEDAPPNRRLWSKTPWLWVAAVLVAAVLAAPAIRRPEVRDPAKTARRAATLSELA